MNKSAKTKAPVTIMLKFETIEELDRVAERLKLSRSQMADNFINVGMETFSLYEKAGVVKMYELTRDFVDIFKEKQEEQLAAAIER